ncbi:amidase domain-containing protein [Agromyces sp. MMS24-K17]|uniref:amidase domain-containing protein n=1 Tax=Agromyces sp. MMS24-K17 TaxID=3372850 RepID=UPI003754A0DC
MSMHQPEPESQPDPDRVTHAQAQRPAESADGGRHAAPQAGIPRRTLVVAAASVAAVGLVGAIAFGAMQGGADDPAGAGAAGDAVSAAGPGAGSDDAAGEADQADVAVNVTAAVAAQLAYVEAHWQDTENDEFGYLEESDCVNFASQSLLERGWQVDDEWRHTEDGDPYASSPAWISSTAFRDYLEEHPERATALTDDQRDQVKVGDIVQFDWDDSGDRDHTGIVTAVTVEADGSISIAYAGHTDATWDRTVDEAIHVIHPGGTAYYWSIPA